MVKPSLFFIKLKKKIKNSLKPYSFEVRKAIYIQNHYNLDALKKTKKIIIFLVPASTYVNGGIMSIFSLCRYSRLIAKDYVCLISTVPGKITYAYNNMFKNNEKVFRWKQIIEISDSLTNLIIHIPEYYAKKFYKDLDKLDIDVLKKIPELQINIMNQNVELMPNPQALSDLYKLTDNITQTISNNKYVNQSISDKWKIPTHYLPVWLPTDHYKKYDFDEKEKIIVLSHDKNIYKNNIINILKINLPDWKIITVRNLSFDEYMDLIAKAFFTISFGEGFDSYFIQPISVRSMGLTVYNDEFFPDKSWRELGNVFLSYHEMQERIVSKIIYFFNNKKIYYDTINIIFEKIKTKKIYNYDIYIESLKNFYNKKYDFSPSFQS
ncbi:MAG: hypothetical protein J6W62_07470 [Spirochaetia bacterium]|nr:hypothetical protein [Spirochaetia bacterium]